jgi:hypothetical protein
VTPLHINTEPRTELTRLYGVTEADIRAAVSLPDRDEILTAGDDARPLQCRLYVKELARVRPTRSLLVATRVDPDNEKLYAALSFPPASVPTDLTPLATLKALCERYRTNVVVAGTERRLIYAQTFNLVEAGGHMITAKRPLGTENTEPYVMASAIYRYKKSTSVLTVAIAFAIHVDATGRQRRFGEMTRDSNVSIA